jgi:hypothetical protein
MNFKFPNLIKLNNVDLTDESRDPLEITRDAREVVVDLASGKKVKYVKKIVKKFSVSWDKMPMNASQTIDGKGGRNELRNIVALGGPIPLVIQDGTNPPETYTVFVTNYSERLNMRRDGYYQYSVSLELEEQG